MLNGSIVDEGRVDKGRVDEGRVDEGRVDEGRVEEFMVSLKDKILKLDIEPDSTPSSSGSIYFDRTQNYIKHRLEEGFPGLSPSLIWEHSLAWASVYEVYYQFNGDIKPIIERLSTLASTERTRTKDTTKEFLNKLDLFRLAAYELLTASSKVSAELFNMGYPFSGAFEEVILKINNWSEVLEKEVDRASRHGVLVAYKDNESAIVLSKYDRGSLGCFYIVDNKGNVEAWPDSYITKTEVELLANWGFDTVCQAESVGAIISHKELVDE